jgi:hypothetical protein
MSYLRSLTAPSGEVHYSRTSRQTPVWVTAQAVAALSHKTLPLAEVPREKRAAATTSAPAAAPTATATPAKTVKVQSLPPVGTPAPTAPPPALAAAARVPALAPLVAALM